MSKEIKQQVYARDRLKALLLPTATHEQKVAGSTVWHVIRLAKHIEQRLEFEVHRPMGWSWAGFRIMVNLRAIKVAEPSQLAVILGVSRPSITSNIDKLERDGFVIRERDPDNGSKVRVMLTPKGAAAVEKVYPAQNRIELEYVGGLSEAEREQLDALLQKWFESLDDGP